MASTDEDAMNLFISRCAHNRRPVLTTTDRFAFAIH
jgi:hypothetical protein